MEACSRPTLLWTIAGHRSTGGFRIAVGDRNGDLFVVAQDDAGLLVAKIVHQAVVQATEIGARHDRGILDPQASEHRGDHVAAPLGLLRSLDRNAQGFQHLARHAHH